MAIALENKPNVVAPGGDYPYGRIKDDTGTGDGTPVNTEVYGDFHQFFAKLLADAGVVANGEPENADDGFQYHDALKKRVEAYSSGEWVEVGGAGAPSFNAGYASETFGGVYAPVQFRKEGNTVRVIGGMTAQPVGGVAFTLPAGYRPDTLILSAVSNDPVIAFCQIRANGDFYVPDIDVSNLFILNATFPLG